MEEGEEPGMTDWYSHVAVPQFHRVLWVVGSTASGKSTFARKAAEQLGVGLVEAGGWARKALPNGSVQQLTELSMARLRGDHRYGSRYVASELELRCPCVVAGSRNPTDFVDGFDPVLDAAVILGLQSFPPVTEFERTGIEAIQAYLRFLIACGMTREEQYVVAEPRGTTPCVP